MVRPPLTHLEHERGQRLGMLLRKIETGRIATPAFFTVAALADALGLSLAEIARACAGSPGDAALSA
jgi:hypothetical protein